MKSATVAADGGQGILAGKAEAGKLGVLAAGAYVIRVRGVLLVRAEAGKLGVLETGAYVRGTRSLGSRSISFGTES
jgi:hypothetical protein